MLIVLDIYLGHRRYRERGVVHNWFLSIAIATPPARTMYFISRPDDTNMVHMYYTLSLSLSLSLLNLYCVAWLCIQYRFIRWHIRNQSINT